MDRVTFIREESPGKNSHDSGQGGKQGKRTQVVCAPGNHDESMRCCDGLIELLQWREKSLSLKTRRVPFDLDALQGRAA